MSQGTSGDPAPAQTPSKLRAWAKWLLRLVVSIAFLSLVITRTDGSRAGILVARVHWGWWALGLALMLFAPLASAQRFRLLIRGLRHRVSLGSVLAINLEAMFFSLVFPELVGGVVRWDRVSRHTRDRLGALALVAAERLIDWAMLALVAAAAAPLLFEGDVAPRLRVFVASAAGAVAALGCAAVFAARARSLALAIKRWRERCGPRSAVWVDRLVQLLVAGRALSTDTRTTLSSLFWTAVFWFASLAGSFVMARAVFPQMPMLPYVGATAALAFLAQLPLTIAGVGLRELSLPVLLGAYGVTAEVGLLVGLSAFLPYLLLGTAGLLVRLLGLSRLRQENSAST